MAKPSRILVVGAGASLAEAKAMGLPETLHPPLISNFAKKFWAEFNPHPILDMFLESLGYEVSGRDGREKFYELEARRRTDIERFFEFAWRHRKKNWEPRKSSNPEDPNALPKDYIHGFTVNIAGKNAISIGAGKPLLSWENLIYHGIGNPLQFHLLQGFFESGKGCKPLITAQAVSGKLRTGDIVLNLNYDPLFEIGLKQRGHNFTYAVQSLSENTINVCKPHGTLNMAVSEDSRRCVFGEPEHLAALPPQGWRSFLGILPPRFNKAYAEHPLARSIVSTLKSLEPAVVTFWGVGLTASDVDLLELYRNWIRSAEAIEVINPDQRVPDKFRAELSTDVQHFSTHDLWLAHGN